MKSDQKKDKKKEKKKEKKQKKEKREEEEQVHDEDEAIVEEPADSPRVSKRKLSSDESPAAKKSRVAAEAEAEAEAGDDQPPSPSFQALKKSKSPSTSSNPSSSSSSSGSGDPDGGNVRIFLGNLPFKITDELIQEYFGEFGEIAGIHWVTDKSTGQFYGSAFIDYATSSAASSALCRDGCEILGRSIKVNWATGSNQSGKNRFNLKEKKGAHLAAIPISAKPDGCNTVFLGNLSFEIDEPTIRKVFAHCGDITDVRWVEKDGEFKGCGFVEFSSSSSTDEAVKLNGSVVLSRPMRVDYSARASSQRE